MISFDLTELVFELAFLLDCFDSFLLFDFERAGALDAFGAFASLTIFCCFGSAFLSGGGLALPKSKCRVFSSKIIPN